jgi:hypothetical protein
MPRMAYEEITARGYEDWLVSWCRARKGNGLCKKASQDVQQRYGVLSEYVQTNFKKKPQQVRDWFDDADGWVIAHAMAGKKDVVVTEEDEKKSNRNKIKIPILCKAFDVEWINTATLMRDRLIANFSRK